MKKKETDRLYLDKFIQSMENDYEKWKAVRHNSLSGSWIEYHSPDYENENGRVSFGFCLTATGAWVDGFFQWRLPWLNPFSKSFWRFRRAKQKIKSYLQHKEQQAYLQKLNSVID